MKAIAVVVLCAIAWVSFTGLSTFDTSLWIAYAVMAAIELVMAVALMSTRWRNRPAAIVLAMLAVFQAGQSYYYEQVRYSRNDPVIALDNFGVLLLCVLAVALIAVGPPWPIRRRS